MLLWPARYRRIRCAPAAALHRLAHRFAPNPLRMPRCGTAALRPSHFPSATAALSRATTTECGSISSFVLTHVSVPPWDPPASLSVPEELLPPARCRPAIGRRQKKKGHPADSIRIALRP